MISRQRGRRQRRRTDSTLRGHRPSQRRERFDLELELRGKSVGKMGGRWIRGTRGSSCGVGLSERTFTSCSPDIIAPVKNICISFMFGNYPTLASKTRSQGFRVCPLDPARMADSFPRKQPILFTRQVFHKKSPHSQEGRP